MICPNCQKDSTITEQNYGALYTCPECQAVYFINFEGQPEFGEEQIAVEESFAEPAAPQEFNVEVNPEFANTEINPFEPQAATEFLSQDQSLDQNLDQNSFGSIADEISSFGNEDVQIAGLNYDLKISGLDTNEIKRLFKEAIEDSKFAWDPNEIFKQIKNGQIELNRLNPVKAYILAKRLQFLDIEKQWTKNVMS